MSQQKNKLEAIRDYFLNCPVLDQHSIIRVDYLGERLDEEVEYSIMSEINSNMIIKQYTDGTSLRQYPFSIMSKEDFSPEIQSQIAASSLYEDLQEWIETQNRIGNLPDIEGIQTIEIVSPVYLFNAEENSATYQIQCRILYIKEV